MTSFLPTSLSVKIRMHLQFSYKHAIGENAWTGIDGHQGVIADMKELKGFLKLSMISRFKCADLGKIGEKDY